MSGLLRHSAEARTGPTGPQVQVRGLQGSLLLGVPAELGDHPEPRTLHAQERLPVPAAGAKDELQTVQRRLQEVLTASHESREWTVGSQRNGRESDLINY